MLHVIGTNLGIGLGIGIGCLVIAAIVVTLFLVYRKPGCPRFVIIYHIE